MSLYEKLKGKYPRKFRVDRHSSLDVPDKEGRKRSNPCYHCVVSQRNPFDCDPCNLNPDRKRMVRIGLLNA